MSCSVKNITESLKNKVNYEVRMLKLATIILSFTKILQTSKIQRRINELNWEGTQFNQDLSIPKRKDQITDPYDISNRLNSHFSQIGPKEY